MQTYSSLIRHPGNAGLFTAVEMSIVSALTGRPLHLHAEGLRGTGKTTILRAARDTLPRIDRIKGCIYNCRPDRPHCPIHRNLPAPDIEKLGTESVPMPFFEISHSAKVGTVVGSVDLAALTDRTRPVAALLPGTLPRAHRGIIFVDEINRLADTSPDLADVLLDAMGTKPGRVQIEETGLPLIELPVEVTVWAASNPDEDPGPLADIRRQLSDRFDLTVSMARPNRSDVVTRILDLSHNHESAAPSVSQRLADAYRGEPGETEAPAATIDEAGAGMTSQSPYPHAVELLSRVQWPSATRLILADLYVDFGLESLRAVEAMQQAATLRCALTGRNEVGIPDLVAVAGLALRHRVDLALLARITAHLQSLEAKANAALQAGQDGTAPVVPTQNPNQSQTQIQPSQQPGRQAARSDSQASGQGQEGHPEAGQNGPASRPGTANGPAAQPSQVSNSRPFPGSPGQLNQINERGGIGRILARFLGGSGSPPRGTGGGTGDPYPTDGAANGQGHSGTAGQGLGQTGGSGATGPAGDVASPPHRARTIFDLVPDDVINVPEDVRRV